MAVLGAAPVGHAGAAKACAFSADGRLLASGGSDRMLRIWDIGAWTTETPSPPEHSLHAFAGRIFCVAFSPDGRWLAAAGADLTVRVWELPEARLKHVVHRTAPFMQRVAFSPDS